MAFNLRLALLAMLLVSRARCWGENSPRSLVMSGYPSFLCQEGLRREESSGGGERRGEQPSALREQAGPPPMG